MFKRLPNLYRSTSIPEAVLVGDPTTDDGSLLAWHEHRIAGDGTATDTIRIAKIDERMSILTRSSALLTLDGGSQLQWRTRAGGDPELTYLVGGVLTSTGSITAPDVGPVTDYWSAPISRYAWSADGTGLALSIPTADTSSRTITSPSGRPMAERADIAEQRPDGLTVDARHELWFRLEGGEPTAPLRDARLPPGGRRDDRGRAWHVGEVAVLPDNERVLFTAKPRADRYRVGGSRLYLRRVAPHDTGRPRLECLLETPTQLSGLTTSLDGRFAVYAAPRADRRDRGQAFSRVHVLDIATHEEFCLTPDIDINVGFSPLSDVGHFHPKLTVATGADGGPVVVFLGSRQVSDGLVTTGLYCVGIDSGKITPLFEPTHEHPDAVTGFAVRGDSVVAVTNGAHNPSTLLYRRSHPALSSTPYSTSPIVEPRISRDVHGLGESARDQAVHLRRPPGSENLVAAPVDAANWTRLIGPSPRRPAILRPKVTYREVETGNPAGLVSVELYEPARRRNGAAIAMVHGGPACFWGPGYSELAVTLTKAGFTLIRINSGGSAVTEELVAQAQYLTQWGERDVRDSLAAVRIICADLGVHRLGAIGSSKGGCELAQMIAAAPELFMCAVLDRPVLDLLGNTYGRDDYVNVRIEPDLRVDERQQRLLASSPILSWQRLAAGVVPPTLVISGQSDGRVPAVMEAFTRMLESRGDPAELRVFKSGHLVGTGSIETELRATRSEVITAFFHHHLVRRFASPASPVNDIAWAVNEYRSIGGGKHVKLIRRSQQR